MYTYIICFLIVIHGNIYYFLFVKTKTFDNSITFLTPFILFNKTEKFIKKKRFNELLLLDLPFMGRKEKYKSFELFS